MDSLQTSLISNSRRDLDLENAYLQLAGLPDSHCIVCRRPFIHETESNEGFEAIFICGECKITFLDELDINITPRDSSHRRQQRRAQSGSSESVEDLFSQQLSEMLGLLRQNHEAQQRARFNMYRNRSRRWRHALSDTGSDGFDNVDSLLGESDSNISLSGYGGESDASVDGRDVFIQQDDGSDTDIDPMHAGLDQWNSDDDDADGEWEEAEIEEGNGIMEQGRQMQYAGDSPAGSSGRDIHSGGWLLWRTQEDRPTNYSNVFTDIEESELPHYFGNSGDYLDSRGFEELLEQLTENDGSRRGAPPAAVSYVKKLPLVVLSRSHEKNGSLICPVCKDPLLAGTVANQLPCLHFYHPACILPWLSRRNSCPVCRYELPTDDPDYEEGKRNRHSRRNYHQNQQENLVGENSLGASSDSEVDESRAIAERRGGQGDVANVEPDGNENQQRGGWGWVYLAATSIVGIVGMVLVMGLQNSHANARTSRHSGGQDPQQFQRSTRNNVGQEDQANRARRWWSPF